MIPTLHRLRLNSFPQGGASVSTLGCKSPATKNEDDNCDSEEEDVDIKLDFTPVYPDQEELFIVDWILTDEGVFKVLCQFASLYAYQNGDILSKMIYMDSQSMSIDNELQNPDLYYEIKGLPGIRALMLVKNGSPDIPLPEILKNYLNDNTVSLRSKLGVVEDLLLSLATSYFNQKRIAKRRDRFDGPTKALITQSVEECQHWARGRRTFGNTPRADAKLVFDFVRDGLRDAFANRMMLNPLKPGTVLYHGSDIPDARSRKHLKFNHQRQGNGPRMSGKTFEEDVADLTNGPLSTTTDITIAYNFYNYSNYGSILCLELQTPVDVIIYASLDRTSQSVWNTKPKEHEVMLPPGLIYTVVDGEYCETRPKVRSRVHKVLVRVNN
jgi:hypothetical protein